MSNFPTIQGMGGSLQEALTDKVKVQTTSTSGVQHIKYDAYSGDWTVGKDNDDIGGETVTIITNSIQHGWHRWADREVFKRMASFMADLPEKPDSVEDRKGKTQTASEARGFQCVMDEEDGTTTQMSWEHSTDGCRRAIDALLEETMARAQIEPEFLYPVVKLTNDKPYENSYKDGEMIYPPKLEIIGWRNHEGDDAPDEQEKIAAPKAKAKAKAEPVEDEPEAEGGASEDVAAEAEETAAEEAAPTRRRRRSRSAA